MISKKQIQLEVEGLISLKDLVEVYEEVSAARMQKVRGAVLQSRQFLEGLLEVFMKVKSAYQKKDKQQLTSIRRRNGKTVAVFISANAGLYGDIVDRTFDVFSGFVQQNNPEVVILGKLGVKMMGEHLPHTLYNYFDFADEGVEADSFEMIMRYLIQFEKIIIFYGKFKTILSQDPVATSVSGDDVLVQVEEVEQTKGNQNVPATEKQYLFEPSIEHIASVFEGEIMASLFEQTLHESQLAKFASRMLALDRSIDNIERRLGRVRLEEKKVAHKIRNRKQLSTIAGLALWSTHE